ncbi:unnamed protein product [Adineta steineri]|uniref:Uncharacterized protein n=1 Tax=Adineta steineri TaxID=433720 RepID=A0A815A398_9BILA|nr:unnamed protein product [Adineta steineri]CAF1538045.1 unnamed protein product [Adineta steineri]
MERILYLSLFILCTLHGVLDGAHFRGGILSWRPLNNTASGSTAQILVHQRYFWNREWGSFSVPYCTEANVAAQTPIPVGAYMTCLANCSSSNYPSGGLSANMITTDCDSNPIIQSWAGEHYDTLTLPLTTSITIGYPSSAWFASLYIGANDPWSIVSRMNLALRPDGLINSSPVTTTLPVVFYSTLTPIVHIVQMADNDGTDILICRWSNSASTTNYNRYDECGGICMGLPPSTVLIGSSCTLSFTLPTANLYYACALQIEDFYNTSSTTPMSSVPIQFLFYAYNPSASACAQRPSITSARPNKACIGIPVGVQLNETVIAQTYCPGQTIVDFVTSSPIGMTHSAISNPSSGTWIMTLTWTPVSTQSGPQGFCAGAIDNSSLQSDPWCITFSVGFISPELIQSSVAPMGNISQNQTVFSIQTTMAAKRPSRNGTYIHFTDSTNNTVVQIYDCSSAPQVTYINFTIVIRFPVAPWIPGHSYFVTFDSGVYELFLRHSVFD